MRLVNDHRVVAFGQRNDLVEDVRKLLQRRHDDASLLASQRIGQLRRRLLDALHHAYRVLELTDRVLQLAIKHDPVGNDHHLVEHSGVVIGMQR